MKTVAILAPTGMLGSMVYAVLKDTCKLVLVYRNPAKLELLENVYGGTSGHVCIQSSIDDVYRDFLDGFSYKQLGPRTKKLFEAIGNVDMVINCAGIINTHAGRDPALTMFVNGAFPWVLSNYYLNKLIHVTTDCAFNGITGAPYTELSPLSPNDFYGLSKSMGEPKEQSLVFRTSIVGPELGPGGVSLLEWFRSQAGQRVQGYITHKWNGITTKEFARACSAVISNRSAYPEHGLYHLFSNDMTKLEMLELFKKKYALDIDIESAAPAPVDRRLDTMHDVCGKLAFPSFAQMVEDL